jgi:DNA-binding CsgD family transcriptional regulator
MQRLDARDLEALLRFAAEAHDADSPAPFTPGLLGRFASTVGCEEASFFEVDHPRRIISERITASTRPWNGMPDDVWSCTRTIVLQQRKVASGSGPVMLSEVFRPGLRRSPEFNPNLRDADAVDDIHVDLDPPRGWKAEFAVYGSRDFGPRERLLLEVARPHLAAVYRAWKLRRRLADANARSGEAFAVLTPREQEVMLCVTDGLSNAAIAQVLVVEPNTVRKHLEHVYEKLGVHSRTAAVARLRQFGPDDVASFEPASSPSA